VSRRLIQRIVRFLHKQDGPTAVEYAVMLALIIVVLTTAISAVGGNASGVFGSVFSNSSSGQYGGTSWGSRGDTLAFNSDGSAMSFDGSMAVTLTPTGSNSFSFSATDGEKGTMTINGNTLTVSEPNGSTRDYTKQ
jgi:pilus assembly protein Flp/PilA